MDWLIDKQRANLIRVPWQTCWMTDNYSPFHIIQKANFGEFINEYSKKKSGAFSEFYNYISVVTKNINNISYDEPAQNALPSAVYVYKGRNSCKLST